MPGYANFLQDRPQPALELSIHTRLRAARMPDNHAASRTQDTPCFMKNALPVAYAAQNVHEQDHVERAVLEWEPPSIGQGQKAIPGVRGKFPQHGKRCIHAGVEIACSYESPANPSCPCAQIEDTRRRGDTCCGQYGGADCCRCLRGKRTVVFEAAGAQVKGGSHSGSAIALRLELEEFGIEPIP